MVHRSQFVYLSAGPQQASSSRLPVPRPTSRSPSRRPSPRPVSARHRSQLIHVKRRRNQHPIRDFAIFHVLLRTGLRISELLRLDLDQYRGKHFANVKRKGRSVTREIFLAAEAREALDRYIDEVRAREPGPLFLSRSGKRLARQNVDSALKAIASQANARFPDDQKIRLHAHVLRHTCLRRAAEKHGVQYAMELSGQSSERYIWRYVQPSSDQKEAALDELF